MDSCPHYFQFPFFNDYLLSAVDSFPTLDVGGGHFSYDCDLISSNFDWEVICHTYSLLKFLSVVQTLAVVYFNPLCDLLTYWRSVCCDIVIVPCHSKPKNQPQGYEIN
jgi:hypothetical protein